MMKTRLGNTSRLELMGPLSAVSMQCTVKHSLFVRNNFQLLCLFSLSGKCPNLAISIAGDNVVEDFDHFDDINVHIVHPTRYAKMLILNEKLFIFGLSPNYFCVKLLSQWQSNVSR